MFGFQSWHKYTRQHNYYSRQYQILWKSFQWFLSCYMRTRGKIITADLIAVFSANFRLDCLEIAKNRTPRRRFRNGNWNWISWRHLVKFYVSIGMCNLKLTSETSLKYIRHFSHRSRTPNLCSRLFTNRLLLSSDENSVPRMNWQNRNIHGTAKLTNRYVDIKMAQTGRNM